MDIIQTYLKKQPPLFRQMEKTNRGILYTKAIDDRGFKNKIYIHVIPNKDTGQYADLINCEKIYNRIITSIDKYKVYFHRVRKKLNDPRLINVDEEFFIKNCKVIWIQFYFNNTVDIAFDTNFIYGDNYIDVEVDQSGKPSGCNIRV